jgi:hypothetical protein
MEINDFPFHKLGDQVVMMRTNAGSDVVFQNSANDDASNVTTEQIFLIVFNRVREVESRRRGRISQQSAIRR